MYDIETFDFSDPSKNRNPPAECNFLKIPENYKEMLTDSNKNHWLKAMETEFQKLVERDVWEIVPPKPEARILNCGWVYSVKKNTAGRITRYKAHLVAKGCSQREGIGFSETFCLVVHFTIIRMFFAFCVIHMEWEHRLVDVTNAYLYGKLETELYMRQPPGFQIGGKEDHVCKLKKSIYGLRQSGHEWWKELHLYSVSKV